MALYQVFGNPGCFEIAAGLVGERTVRGCDRVVQHFVLRIVVYDIDALTPLRRLHDVPLRVRNPKLPHGFEILNRGIHPRLFEGGQGIYAGHVIVQMELLPLVNRAWQAVGFLAMQRAHHSLFGSHCLFSVCSAGAV